MDPIQSILTALMAGDPADTNATRAHGALKAALLRAFGDNPKAARALNDYLDDPETYERPLAKALLDARADTNAEVLTAVRQLLRQEPPRETDVLREIRSREENRTGDRFTRRAEGVSELKAQAEAASRQRMDQFWEQERKRQAQVAEQQARQKQQERRLMISVALIVVLFLVVAVAVVLVSTNR